MDKPPTLTWNREKERSMEENRTPGPDRGTALGWGVRDGVPIALGYFAVAFSLGIAGRSVF